FPWFNEGDPILWWSPSPRMVFRPGELHLSRSLKKLLRQQHYRVTLDHDFSGVIRSCAELRQAAEGTWITGDMLDAYQSMHAAGHAHSVEVWSPEGLVGGLYGIAIGQVFFGESMFSRESNTSKIAMATLSRQLADWDFKLCDCQVYSAHLESLGAWLMPREEFMERLDRYCSNPLSSANWKKEWQWNDQSP
ncbi:MAG: leucyl/phenylalanyl-tRNA--protein transferase, partial [Endozoicomonas sp.]